ncbi:MAG: glycosyltransferase, partial [Candidatus Tectomicrobia bacterium]|nr:glycosyltransferase [Candidatus Tectomicrobia bacterium]
MLNRAIFVASESAMAHRPGGVQRCTREYMAVLREAGFDLTEVTFQFDQRWRAKVLRRLSNRPYANMIPEACVDNIVRASKTHTISTMFLNFGDVVELAPRLKHLLPETRLVLLSYGLESVDYIHTIRSQRLSSPFAGMGRYEELRLARQLIAECNQRLVIDDVVCLSAFEAEIERWLGASRVTWIPRTVTYQPIAWNPIQNRAGFVGTLDHPPNREGLILVLRALQDLKTDIQVQVVGGPTQAGARLEREYDCVTYLGRLSDEALRKEAESWGCFLHPVFCYARGASTKLAVGLEWGLPIVTTPPGCRGYRWSRGSLVVAESPGDYARA